MTATLAKPPIKSPKRLQDVPEYAAAADKLAALKAERDALKARKNELSELLHNRHGSSKDIHDEVDAKLGLGQFADGGDVPDPRAELAQINHDLFVTERAIERQSTVVNNARLSASTLVCETYRRDYEHATQAMACAIEALETAAIAEHRLRKELEENNIAFSSTLVPTPFPGARDVIYADGDFYKDDHVGEIRAWFQRARAAGHSV